MAASSAKASRAMRNQDPLEKKPLGPAPPPRRHRRKLRCKSPTEVAVKGQLRMRSPSGAFVMVGISVVLVGMTIAVVGYWPHRGPHAAGPGARLGNSSGTGDMKKEVKVSAQARYLPHSEKLKLIGPVIMGVGLFIVICANTMLYENRDMETRLLMQKGLYSMTLGLAQDFSQEDKYCQRRTSLPLLKANAECVEGCYKVDLSSSGFQSCSSPGNKWADCYRHNRLQTTAQLLHHKGISHSMSLLSVRSDSGNSMEGNLNLSFTRGAESVISLAATARSLPVIQVNNCLIEKPSATRGMGDEGEISLSGRPDEAPRLSWTLPPRGGNVSPRGEDLQGGHVIINIDSGPPSITAGETYLNPDSTENEFSSDVQLHNPGHSKSLDLGRPGVLLVAPIKDRKNRSWPRLDQISVVGYAKLESTGESSDRLLEQTDQQGPDETSPSTQEV
ncbi:transmembrane protein 200B isoform X2 [Dermochelys coriacea]|nr:transmembrane protein 200B isoform X2 [Dermochelys coriacea]XP_038233763.1 transmembrane protein 200B isoform X2 [Dermochelys coriacea]XP_043362118.1 transmembrane protein 200B isoform X2 [Dermochelys coriacea]XP_043362119.1 transmembrane protein 200B isoform X2 [Dermochelys coriacea]XP_043362120.1 transmembrane protein 200B isoform X2 [Dermochelys coriacea]